MRPSEHRTSRAARRSFTTTEIARCTIIRNNVIVENNNLTVPANGIPAGTWGSGVELPGDYADLVEGNTITDNATNGVLGFEYPNPFPPEADTIFFQLAGNRSATTRSRQRSRPHLRRQPLRRRPDADGRLRRARRRTGAALGQTTAASGNVFTDATFPREDRRKVGLPEQDHPEARIRRHRSAATRSDRIPAAGCRKNPKRGARWANRRRHHSRRCPTRAKECPRTRCAREATAGSTSILLKRPMPRRVSSRRRGMVGLRAQRRRASALKRSPRSSKSR